MKIALITGANSGFGKLSTVELLQTGFHVVACMRDTANQTSLVEEAEKQGCLQQLTILEIDITSEKTIVAAKEHVENTFGKLDVLVNNAGFCAGGFLEDMSFEAWEMQQNTNINGTFRMTKRFISLLEKAENAKIINISSVSGYFGFPGMSAYCTSKFALEGMSESLRLELLPKNIYVSLVEPASYQTKIWDKGLAGIEVTTEDEPYKQKIFKYATMSAKGGSNPIEVAKLIRTIAISKKPKFRYPVGKGAKGLSRLKRLLPWRFIEWVVLKKLK